MDALGTTTSDNVAGAGWTGSHEPPVVNRQDDRQSASGDEAGWIRIHEQLLQVAGQQAALDYDQGRLLLAALREGVYAKLGYGSLVEYAERILGHRPRHTGERLRVAEALEELPELAQALRTGRLCWSVVRELSRVAIAATEREWLQAAEGKTARDVERAVAGKKKGQRPADPVDPEVKTYRLSFEVSAETLAAFREGVDKLRRDTGEKLSEEEALMLMARQVLGGPGEEGRAGYQVAMTVCERCGQGFQESRGELLPVDEEVTEAALCDSQHIGLVGNSSCCQSDPRGHTDVGTGAPAAATIPVRPPRASQAIPPAISRLVRHRQHGRCAVPGCRGGSIWFELHHLRYRHDGKCGPDDVIGLCFAHHRRAHAGLLIIDGAPSQQLRFYHADGSEYGGAVSAPALAVREQALHALVRGLGFHEQQAKLALAKVCIRTGGQPSLEEVMRQALAILT